MDEKLLDIDSLAQQIDYHNRLYFIKAAPEISDFQFDELTEQLRALDPENPVLLRLYATENSDKIKLRTPMLSLDKAYSLEAVLAWAEKVVRDENEMFLIQPKYDGVSAFYDGHYLMTRGDGMIGENITDKLPLVEFVSTDFQAKRSSEIRGEIVISNDDFVYKWSSILRKDGSCYKNQRNAVAGILGLKDITEMSYIFELEKTHLKLLDYNEYSFELSFKNLKEKWLDVEAKIKQLSYPLDGIVVKLKDLIYSQSLGCTAHHPRGQIAYKFTNPKAETKLLNIQWFCGKHSLTPVGEVEPVSLGGTTICNVTLHNAQNVIEKDIQIGDYVEIERAGDVIPYVKSVRTGEVRRSGLIELCPSCGTPLIRKSVDFVCPNENCAGTQLQRLLAAVKQLEIEELGEPTLLEMQQILQVHHLSDLLKLTVNDLLRLKGFAERKAFKLYDQLQRARSILPAQFLASLNIQGIGPNLATLILKNMSLQQLRHATYESFIIGEGSKAKSVIPGIGPERARTMIEHLAENSDMIDELLGVISLKESDLMQRDLPTICFTGKMPEKRAYYEALASKNGYKVVDSVNANLTLLVRSDALEFSSKVEKAEQFGVSVITLDQWFQTIKKEFEDFETKKIDEDDLFGFF